jgi:hypothetical protein
MEAPTPDVYALITTIVRLEASLRMLAYHPTMYPPNGHAPRIANLLTVLEGEIHGWMDGTAWEHRHSQRRQQPERRIGPERRIDPPDQTVVP